MAEAARIGGMERQTLRDWVHRFNGSGPEGLIDRKAPGKLQKLNSEQKAGWRRWWKRARPRRFMAWCAGA